MIRQSGSDIEGGINLPGSQNYADSLLKKQLSLKSKPDHIQTTASDHRLRWASTSSTTTFDLNTTPKLTADLKHTLKYTVILN